MSRRGFLKAATSALHEELDAGLAALDLGSYQGYRAYIRGSAAAHFALERALIAAGVEELFTDWPQRSRAEALRSDLAALCVAPPNAVVERELTGPSEVFGVMYALEGSRLGGQFILRHVLAAAQPRIEEATHYLRGGDPGLWRSFLARLESAPEAGDQAALVSGARHAFAVFRASFAPLCAPVATSPAASPLLRVPVLL